MNRAKKLEIDGRTRIHSIAFLRDGRHLLGGGDDAIIRQWRIDDGVEVGERLKTSSTITAMDLSADGTWIVSSGERVANVWSTRSRQITLTVNDHSDWVDTVHVSLDSTKFATGSNDKKVFIWDISTGERLVGPLEHGDRVGAVRFSPDGDRIATGTEHQGLRIYNARNGELLRTIPFLVVSYPSPIAWFNSQNIFVLASCTALVHIDVDTGRTSSSWTIPGEFASYAGSIAFGSVSLSSNGRLIVSSAGRAVSLWDTLTSARISSDLQHSSTVWSIALSSDNKHLAITDGDNKIILYNLDGTTSDYYLAGQGVAQQPQNRYENDPQPQIETLRGELRALQLRVDQLTGIPTLPDELLRAAVPPRAENFEVAGRVDEQRFRLLGIFDGTYRIKSYTNGLYLTCPQEGVGTVVMQQSDESNVSQRWTISLVADGAYNITCHRGNSDVLLSTANVNALVCVPGGEHTTWTIEPRGEAYVIGNSADAMAIHLRRGHQGVSVSVRNNSKNQRWVLERVVNHDEAMPV